MPWGMSAPGQERTHAIQKNRANSIRRRGPSAKLNAKAQDGYLKCDWG